MFIVCIILADMKYEEAFLYFSGSLDWENEKSLSAQAAKFKQ